MQVISTGDKKATRWGWLLPMADNAISPIFIVAVTQNNAGGLPQLFLEQQDVLSFAFSPETDLAITAFKEQLYAKFPSQVTEDIAGDFFSRTYAEPRYPIRGYFSIAIGPAGHYAPPSFEFSGTLINVLENCTSSL